MTGSGLQISRDTFIRFLDEGHGWRKLSNRLFYQREEARFIAEQFGLAGRMIS